MNVLELNSSHLQYLQPSYSEDDLSHFVHAVVDGECGIDLETLQRAHAGEIRIEYHGTDGDIYPVTSVMFGYLIEVKRRDTLDIVEWVNDEMSLRQGMLDAEEVYNETAVPSDVFFAAGAEAEYVDEPGGDVPPDEGKPVVIALGFKNRFAPKVLWLAGGTLIPINTLVNANRAVEAFSIQLDGVSDINDWIRENLPGLVCHTVHMDDVVQETWLLNGLAPEILVVN